MCKQVLVSVPIFCHSTYDLLGPHHNLLFAFPSTFSSNHSLKTSLHSRLFCQRIQCPRRRIGNCLCEPFHAGQHGQENPSYRSYHLRYSSSHPGLQEQIAEPLVGGKMRTKARLFQICKPLCLPKSNLPWRTFTRMIPKQRGLLRNPDYLSWLR